MTSKMTINKYQGKTKEEAIEKAKQELGEGAVVMNVKEIKPTGENCKNIESGSG